MYEEYQGLQIEVLNPVDAVQILRSLGLQLSESTLREGIAQGAFPFGSTVHCEKTTRSVIYKTLFDKWIAERATKRTDFEVNA